MGVMLTRREQGALVSDYLEKRYGWLWQRTRGVPLEKARYDLANAWFDDFDVSLHGAPRPVDERRYGGVVHGATLAHDTAQVPVADLDNERPRDQGVAGVD